MAVETTHPLGTAHVRLYPGGPIVPIIRYEAKDSAGIFPLEHVFGDMSQMMQQDHRAELPDSVGELTLAGEIADGWVDRPSKKYQKNVLWRRNWTPKEPEGLPCDDGYHGTPRSFLGMLEEDGTWGGKLANPWTASEEELSAFPECLRARFRTFGDACECDQPTGLAVDSPVAPLTACDCDIPQAIVIDEAGIVGSVCECDAPLSS